MCKEEKEIVSVVPLFRTKISGPFTPKVFYYFLLLLFAKGFLLESKYRIIFVLLTSEVKLKGIMILYRGYFPPSNGEMKV